MGLPIFSTYSTISEWWWRQNSWYSGTGLSVEVKSTVFTPKIHASKHKHQQNLVGVTPENTVTQDLCTLQDTYVNELYKWHDVLTILQFVCHTCQCNIICHYATKESNSKESAGVNWELLYPTKPRGHTTGIVPNPRTNIFFIWKVQERVRWAWGGRFFTSLVNGAGRGLFVSPC